MLKLTLDSKTIYNKVFQGNKSGYDALQVDQFLDIIIKDYQEIEKFTLDIQIKMETLEQDVTTLNEQVKVLQAENTTLKEKLRDFQENKDANINNIDYLKRISKLENALYKVGINPNNID